MEFKRSVRCNIHRKSFYGLLLLVRTARVVRVSWNLKEVSVVIFTAKCVKIAKVCIGLLLHVRVVRVVRGLCF